MTKHSTRGGAMTDTAAIDPQTVLDGLGRLILRLKSELAEADVIDQNSVSDPTDRGRAGAIYALWAVITFLDDLGCSDDGLGPVSLMRLLAALQDTDNGKAHPMLVPKKVGHRRDSLELKELKMQSALAMQLLMDSGLIESEKVKDKAASEVAKRLCKESVTLPGFSRHPTKKTVASWRDSLRPTPGFQRRLSAIQEIDVSPRDMANNALAALSAFARGMSGDREHTPSPSRHSPPRIEKHPPRKPI
jgi:hypothetical protein